MRHKHYVFNLIDKIPKNKRPNNLALYLKAAMMYYVAQNKLQKDLKGDEMDYINMIADEFVLTKDD